jgi:hypothetical protein
MAALILAQDVLGICLVLSKGDIDARLETIVRRVESFQKVKNRHFGISVYDFRNLFYRLKNNFPVDCNLEQVTLGDVLNKILGFGSTYFNDEGEYWDLPAINHFSDIRDFIDYSEEEYQTKVTEKQRVISFFSNLEESRKPEIVRKFMSKTGINVNLLYRCSREGDSS